MPGRTLKEAGGQRWFPGKRESQQRRLAQPPRFPYSRLHPQPPRASFAPISSLTWFLDCSYALFPFPLPSIPSTHSYLPFGTSQSTLHCVKDFRASDQSRLSSRCDPDLKTRPPLHNCILVCPRLEFDDQNQFDLIFDIPRI